MSNEDQNSRNINNIITFYMLFGNSSHNNPNGRRRAPVSRNSRNVQRIQNILRERFRRAYESNRGTNEIPNNGSLNSIDHLFGSFGLATSLLDAPFYFNFTNGDLSNDLTRGFNTRGGIQNGSLLSFFRNIFDGISRNAQRPENNAGESDTAADEGLLDDNTTNGDINSYGNDDIMDDESSSYNIGDLESGNGVSSRGGATDSNTGIFDPSHSTGSSNDDSRSVSRSILGRIRSVLSNLGILNLLRGNSDRSASRTNGTNQNTNQNLYNRNQDTLNSFNRRMNTNISDNRRAMSEPAENIQSTGSDIRIEENTRGAEVGRERSSTSNDSNLRSRYSRLLPNLRHIRIRTSNNEPSNTTTEETVEQNNRRLPHVIVFDIIQNNTTISIEFESNDVGLAESLIFFGDAPFFNFNGTANLLTREQLKKIKAFRVKKEFEKQDCSICMNNFRYKEMARTLPCEHTFHSKCVDKWLLSHSNSCPICRKEVSVQISLNINLF